MKTLSFALKDSAVAFVLLLSKKFKNSWYTGRCMAPEIVFKVSKQNQL